MPKNPRAAHAATPKSSPSAKGAEEPEKKVLYAVAIEVLHRITGTWRPDIRYTHAPNQAAAKFAVMAGINWKTHTMRVVGASRVIGYHVNDKKGLILSV